MFLLPIQELTPCQLYISEKKLKNIYTWFDGNIDKIHPIPIKQLAGRLIVVDGHTRLLAALIAGAKYIPCEWETGNWDWAAYASDIAMCAEEGITSIENLKNRIVSDEDYERLWLRRCQALKDEWYYKVLTQKDEVIFYTQNAIDIPVCDIRKIDIDKEIQYYGLFEKDIQVAYGCIEPYSFEFWEAAAIKTKPEYRNNGFGFQITAFLTNLIVHSGKTATCRTLPENTAMNRVISKCGYQKLYE